MIIGILSDTHNQVDRTRTAVEALCDAGADLIVHCGDLTCPSIVEACSVLPFWFVFGNNDADTANELARAADELGAHCLKWGGNFTVADRSIAVAHGHFPRDYRPLLEAKPDYFLSGHSHKQHDHMNGSTRCINPGALYRARDYSVATLNPETDTLNFLTIAR